MVKTPREGRPAEGAREERPGAHEGRGEILIPNQRTLRSGSDCVATTRRHILLPKGEYLSSTTAFKYDTDSFLLLLLGAFKLGGYV